MRPARLAVLAGSIVAMVVAVAVSAQQTKPAKPMQIEKVKDGLYVIRGPFNPCAPNGCGGGYGDDGLLHEAGDVAVRVTSEGLILVDDKYQNNVADVLEEVKSVSAMPIKPVRRPPIRSATMPRMGRKSDPPSSGMAVKTTLPGRVSRFQDLAMTVTYPLHP